MWHVGQKVSTCQPRFTKYIIWKGHMTFLPKTYDKKNNSKKINTIIDLNVL